MTEEHQDAPLRGAVELHEPLLGDGMEQTVDDAAGDEMTDDEVETWGMPGEVEPQSIAVEERDVTVVTSLDGSEFHFGGEPAAPPELPVRRPVRRASDRMIVIVDDEATVVRTSSLRALLEVAGDMRTLAEALGVSASTISRALAEAPQEEQGRDARIRAVQQLVRGER